jgi:antitoxin YefM
MVIRVKRRAGRDFIVISAEDWDREQETLYILRNKELMSQVAESLETLTIRSTFLPSGDIIVTRDA